MKQTLQLGVLLLSALALSLTVLSAEGKSVEGKCGDAKKEMKSNSGKCSQDGNKTEKKVPKKGKCGQGKCG